MAYDISKIRFLVVEDNPALCTLFRSLLAGLNVREIAVASNGEIAKKSAISFKPDIVITDYKMAPISGVDFTRWLRQSPESPDVETAVIMTSAYSEVERVMEARDAGVNEFLVKPVTVHTLYQRIRAVIEADRPFVRSENYVGPCRRRGTKASYDGPFRRHDDPGMSPAGEEIEDIMELSI